MKGNGILKIQTNTFYEVYNFHIFSYYYFEFDKTDSIVK